MTAPALYLLDPPDGPAWSPVAGTRPLAEMRAGIWKIRERWEAVTGAETTAVLADHALGFHEGIEPPVRPAGAVDGPAIVAASWFVPSGHALELDAATARLVHEGETVAWMIPPGRRWEGPTEAGGAAEIEGVRLQGAFDLITALEALLPGDCADFLVQDHPRDPVPDGSIVLGDPAEIVLLGAVVEPGVVFDVRHGAVVLDEGAEVRSGTRLEGPLYGGPQSRLLGGLLRGSVFGPFTFVRGEVTSSCFLGYANKSHDGFVGHSLIGHWVNLGAGTTTSNLKNTYGEISLQVGNQRLATGRQFLGSLIADHAKTAIGTLLATGTIVGAGASLFGSEAVPRWVPPFAWGSGGQERMTEEGFLRIAERVLPRRLVEFTPERRAALQALYRRLTSTAE